MTIYISIGNSDNKLSQADWAAFQLNVAGAVRQSDVTIYGEWFSHPTSPFQNACWCIDEPADLTSLKIHLAVLARRYRQDSIAWAPATTEFIKPDV